MRRSTYLSMSALLLFGMAGLSAHAQANSTASRAGDLQIGLGYVGGAPDYPDGVTFYGPAFYATFDFKEHYGIEFAIHQINDKDATRHIYERTYEIGPRYIRHYGRFNPYAKLLVGRGVFNYPLDSANLAFNMAAIGGGVDVSVHKHVNVRLDYEYQRWSFLPKSLSPQLVTAGVAYHF